MKGTTSAPTPAQVQNPVLICSTDLPIPSPKIQQRIPRPHDDILHFRNKDRMVARVFRGLQAALKISQSSVQDWCAMLRPIEACSRLALGVPVVGIRIGIIFRNNSLILRQNIYSETLPGMQVSVGTRFVIDADKH
jgi:hypothetical protein